MYHNQNRDADHQQHGGHGHHAGGQGAWGAGAGGDVIMTPDGYVKQAAGALPGEAKMAFLKKVYGWFFVAVLVAAGAAAGTFYLLSQNMNMLAQVIHNWWIVFALFIVIQMVANRLMFSQGTAKIGLFLLAAAWGVMFGPMVVVAVWVAGGSFVLLWQALGLTVVTFGALTGYVFITKQDFSFLRGALVVGTVVLFGIIIVSFFAPPGTPTIALAICGFAVLLGAGYTLYDTSQILHRCGEGDEIMAAGLLLSDFAFMLWYILQILIHIAASADG